MAPELFLRLIAEAGHHATPDFLCTRCELAIAGRTTCVTPVPDDSVWAV